MNNWEMFLLRFIQAAAPTVENLFIHNSRSVAIFNASDQLFNGVVDAMSQNHVNQQAKVSITETTKTVTSAVTPLKK